MKITKTLFFIFLFLYIINGNGNNILGNKNEFNLEYLDSISNSKKKSKEDTDASDETFLEQKIIYIAPNSSSVFLVWRTVNHPLEKSVLWNENTKLSDGLMYIPMVSKNDTFSVDLKVVKGSIIEYYFWITKNKKGAYQDFWDLQANGTITITKSGSVIKNAEYSKVEVKEKYTILSKGWFVFLLVSIVYGLLKWAQYKWTTTKESSSKIEKVAFIGLSLAIFHAIARSEIININPFNILNNYWIIAKIIKGSISDFLFVACFTGVFILALWWIKRRKVENAIYMIFVFFAFISTLVAFINISIVIYLGKPFTYQWLYYSDFLGSNEAKTAFQANTSAWIGINLILFCISMLVFAYVLRAFFKLLTKQQHLKFITYGLVFLGFITLLIIPFKTRATWTKGQSENAITVMVWSVFTANSNSSFFTAEISDEFKYPQLDSIINKESEYSNIQKDSVKNVLFIVLESAGAVYFDAYGGEYQLSSALNQYAGQSMIFDQMYAHAPATNRSLVSILGSMYPYLSYKSLTQEAPNYKHPTISSILKAKGYRTSFFSSADLRFQNCREYLNHRDFDVVEDFSQITCGENFSLEGSKYKEGNGIDDICLAERLNSWLDEDKTKTFFSIIWTVQGHYPYFFSEEEEDFGVSNIYFNRYLNCLKHNDELIGKVMQMLEEKGLASKTLVVVTGDHGEAFGQHGQFGHGTALYEENVKVPLYLINSKLFHGQRKEDVAGLKDLATTALSILNVGIPEMWQGRNLLVSNSDEAFYFAPWSDYLFGYRKQNMKYIFNETRNTFEVYDLNNDSGEKVNLSKSVSKEEIAKVRSRIAGWVQFQDKFIKEILEKTD